VTLIVTIKLCHTQA